MKPILAGRIALTALLAFCVTGCVSTLRSMSGHMDSEQTARYASMSPEEFVKTRFYTEKINFLHHLNDGLDKILGEGSNDHPSPSVSADGRMVLSMAYYTDINYHQLTKPRQNLQGYCEVARGGRWQTVQAYEKDPIAAAQFDLAAVYSETASQTFENLRRQNGDSGYEPAEAELAKTAGAIATRHAAEQNELMAAAYAGSGFRYAIDEGAFGVFRCDDTTSSWAVSVLPQKFYPADLSNQLTAAGTLLSIRTFTAEEPRPQTVDGAPEPK
jgi:hypothetical protein